MRNIQEKFALQANIYFQISWGLTHRNLSKKTTALSGLQWEVVFHAM